MPQVISTHVPAGLVEQVDEQIEEKEMFESRSGFLRYAVRAQLQREQIQEENNDEN